MFITEILSLAWCVCILYILLSLLSCRCGQSLSPVWFFVTPWTVARQAPLSMGFSRQEYWSGLTFPSPGDLPNPGIEPESPALQADALSSEPPGKPWRCFRDYKWLTQVPKPRIHTMPWSMLFLLQPLAPIPEQCSLLRSGVPLKNMKDKLQ